MLSLFQYPTISPQQQLWGTAMTTPVTVEKGKPWKYALLQNPTNSAPNQGHCTILVMKSAPWFAITKNKARSATCPHSQILGLISGETTHQWLITSKSQLVNLISVFHLDDLISFSLPGALFPALGWMLAAWVQQRWGN